jgi:RNA ligase (TIGR02306 family)
MRKLATIRMIRDIQPIEGADNIELVFIDGWQCVAKKGEFQVGDCCVYFEIDSFLPIKPEFEFLRKSSYRHMGNKEGFRLRTIRLKGQLSQGLALPLSSVGGVEFLMMMGYPLIEGTELSALLGIEKYEQPIPAQLVGKAAGNFPSFIPKTDQERIQNCWKEIDKDAWYEITEKLDGSSITFYIKDGVFGVCSRNWELKRDSGDSYWATVTRLGWDKILLERVNIKPYNVAFQGELIGPGIQKNPYNLNETTIKIFNIFDINTQEYWPPALSDDFVSRVFGVNYYSPIIGYVTIFSNASLGDLLNSADGKSMLNENTNREGFVYKRADGQSSFKVISNKFLEENE